MAVALEKPILMGGMALSFGLWLMNSFGESVAGLDELGVWGAIALGMGVWLWQRRSPKHLELSSVALPVNRDMVVLAMAQAEVAIAKLEAEVPSLNTIPQLRQRLAQLSLELDRQEVQVAITGGKSVGKTRLVQALVSQSLPQLCQGLSWQETPPLFISDEVQEITPTADLLLFVTTGDLTDTEFQTIQKFKAEHQRFILIFNKHDQYLPPERAIILEQLRQRVAEILTGEDVVGIAAFPAPVKVRQHQVDDSVQEWMEEQKPDLNILIERLSHILSQESQQLVWATTLRKVAALKLEVKSILDRDRRDRALPIIEQYQWIAAAAAFANPVPALDLLATAAISGQLIGDLGAIYQQKFSLSQASSSAKALGNLMLKLGLVELSTQTLGGILKSNALTFVAGGAVQGVSAAYLTRLAGLSLIEYFQEQEIIDNSSGAQIFNLDRLGKTLQKVFQQNQRMVFLQDFVRQALGRLGLVAG
ncbi:MAG TPA: hypothetical protein DDW51_10510 [Cyanobacteria bacterium UBA11367]|nr:hypothetical protein [Cyanobacteria bacterium UBA11367]HBE59048.1 hypothetical protein [Cyanobacteria bacterium UBA11366]HBS68766.1 hypothetical protein [Cyanobacteria bacterium UBA11153]